MDNTLCEPFAMFHGSFSAITNRMSLIGIAVAALLLFLIPSPTQAQDNVLRIFSVEDIQTELTTVPCKDEDRMEAVRALFQRIGGPEAVDTLGLSAPQVLDNASSKKLRESAARLAGELKIPFSHATVAAADADSSPFLRRKNPALTIHGLTNDCHPFCTVAMTNSLSLTPLSVYLGYRLVLALVGHIDESPCAAFR